MNCRPVEDDKQEVENILKLCLIRRENNKKKEETHRGSETCFLSRGMTGPFLLLFSSK